MFNSVAILTSHAAILFAFKVALLAGIGLYIIFLFVIFRQVVSMNKLITQYRLSPIMNLLAITSIVSAIFLFLLGLVIL